MADLFAIVFNHDEAGLRQALQHGANVRVRSKEDNSTPLHHAASTGNIAILTVLLEQPNIELDAQNSEGNTPLHVAAAYAHLQAVKMLLSAGARPHSIFVQNNKQKRPIDYAWNPEVRSHLEEYMRMYHEIFSFPDSNVVELKKMFLDSQMDMKEFQEKVKDSIKQLLEEKQVALHKFRLLEQAAGIGDQNTSDNYLNQLAYLQDENERLTSDIVYLKRQIQLRESTIAQQVEELQMLQQSSGARTQADSSTDELSLLQKFEDDRRRQDEEDERSGLVVFIKGEGGTKHLKGGTKEKLVERLTAYGSNYDLQYLQAFLLTYRAFMTPSELLKLITQQYEYTQAQPVRLRVCNTIKYWMENYWFDFQDVDGLRQQLEHFIQHTMASQPKLQQQLNRVLERKVSGTDTQKGSTIRKGDTKVAAPVARTGTSFFKNAALDRPKSLSVANLDKVMKNKVAVNSCVNYMEIDPAELARQLTLVEMELFKQIKPTEFLDQAWMGPDKAINAPGIVALTQWSTRISKWVITEIVSQRDSAKVRAAVYERFVQIAIALDKIKNFNGCMEILTALQSSPVYRLKETMANVSNKTRKIAEELMRENSSELNYKRLRARVHNTDPPLIPFPGVYLQDLVFLEAGSKSYMDPEKKIINFQKHQTTARYILELIGYQNNSFPFEANEDLQAALRSDALNEIVDENTHFDMSLLCEPRQS